MIRDLTRSGHSYFITSFWSPFGFFQIYQKKVTKDPFDFVLENDILRACGS